MDSTRGWSWTSPKETISRLDSHWMCKYPSICRIAQQGGWRKFIWDVWNIISVWKGKILWECESANAMMQCRGQLYPAHIPFYIPPSSLLSSRYLISLIDLIGCSAGCAALPLYLPFPSHFQTYLLSHLCLLLSLSSFSLFPSSDNYAQRASCGFSFQYENRGNILVL